MEVARQYIDQGFSINFVLLTLSISKSQYYHKPNGQKRGRRPSTHTFHVVSGRMVRNDIVVDQIKKLLERPFVDYGYIKVGVWLNRIKGYLINLKKVYRLMKENGLLYSFTAKKRPNRQWVKDLVPNPGEFFEYIECDIKYVYIDDQRRNALLLTMLDVKSRLIMSWKLSWNIRKQDVIDLFYQIQRVFHLPITVYFRTDNGTQFIALLVKEYMMEHGIEQEFTRPATPQQNGHIESYHSIVQRSVCNRISFESLSHAQSIFEQFTVFYNQERIHSGIDYFSPMQYLKKNGIII